MTEIIYLLEVTVYDPALPGEKVLRYCTGSGYVEDGHYYEPRIKHPGQFKRMLYSEGRTSGPSQASHGEVILTNPDGALDALLTYGFDGRTLMIKKALAIGAALSGIVLLAACSMEQPTTTWDEVAIRIKDRQQELNVPLQPLKYGGSNVLPNGIDGTADIAGKPKPLAFGVVKNVTPVCVNTSKLIYQVHAGALQAIPGVYDKGIQLAAGAAYADQADLEANAPAPGEYRAWLAGGCFRLGSAPSGLVTADAVEGLTAAARSASQLIERIAIQAPTIQPAEIELTDIAALHAANPAEVGYYASAETTVAAALDAVAGSIGAWYGFDTAGWLRCGRLEAPAGAPVAIITDPLSIERLPTGDQGRGLPIGKINFGYDRNWTVQGAESLAGRVQLEGVAVWTPITIPAGYWYQVLYGNGIWLVANINGTDAMVSADNGKTWETETRPISGGTISFANGYFFIANGATAQRSTDGRNWTPCSLPGARAGTVVAYGNGLYVMVNGTWATSFTSVDDGLTWTAHTTGYHAINDLVFGNGVFVGVDEANQKIYSTTDGETWTLCTVASHPWRSIAYGNGLVVALSYEAGTAHTAVTTDGENWTVQALPLIKQAQHIAFGSGVFVITSWTTAITGMGHDGLSFVFNNTPVAPIYGGGLGYGNGQFLNFSNAGTATAARCQVTPEIERIAYLANGYRMVSAEDASVLVVHPLAIAANINSLLVYAADAQDEADRLLALYSIDRDRLRLKVPRDQVPTDVVGKVLRLVVPRYGYNAGKLFVVIGAEEDHETGLIILDIWG